MGDPAIGRWCQWTIRKATTNDGRRASGTGFRDSSWHMVISRIQHGYITACGRKVYPWFDIRDRDTREDMPGGDDVPVCKVCSRLTGKGDQDG